MSDREEQREKESRERGGKGRDGKERERGRGGIEEGDRGVTDIR